MTSRTLQLKAKSPSSCSLVLQTELSLPSHMKLLSTSQTPPKTVRQLQSFSMSFIKRVHNIRVTYKVNAFCLQYPACSLRSWRIQWRRKMVSCTFPFLEREILATSRQSAVSHAQCPLWWWTTLKRGEMQMTRESPLKKGRRYFIF